LGELNEMPADAPVGRLQKEGREVLRGLRTCYPSIAWLSKLASISRRRVRVEFGEEK